MEFAMKNLTAGQLNAIVKKLGGEEGALRFLRGELSVSMANTFTINTDSTPFIPEGWRVEEHQQGGQMIWDPTKVSLHLDDTQKNSKAIEGNKLRKKLNDLPVLNANVLDFLLANPTLIPEEWKGKDVFFWGTIYRNSDVILYVRCLYWNEGNWLWNYRWLDCDWNGHNPALVSAG